MIYRLSIIRNVLFEARLILTFFLAIGSLEAAPSIVALDSGEQLIGEVLPQSTEETLVIQSAALGEISLPREHVLSIQSQTPSLSSHAAVVALAEQPAAPTIDDEVAAEERKIIDTLKEFNAPESWSGNMRLGINLSQGDRKWTETYAKGKLEIDPERSPSFYRLTGSYTYRETERSDGTEYKSTDKYDVAFIYRRTFLEDWFVQNALGYRADQIKEIHYEIQETVGLGYRYQPSDSFDFLLGGGGGIEDFEADFEDTRSGLNPVANLFQEMTWRPLARISFIQKFNYYWNPEDSAQFNYILSAAIRVRLTDLLGFEFSYNKSFDNDVGTGDAQDDSQWRNALVVYF